MSCYINKIEPNDRFKFKIPKLSNVYNQDILKISEKARTILLTRGHTICITEMVLV